MAGVHFGLALPHCLGWCMSHPKQEPGCANVHILKGQRGLRSFFVRPPPRAQHVGPKHPGHKKETGPTAEGGEWMGCEGSARAWK
jgi:hypothetical protein